MNQSLDQIYNQALETYNQALESYSAGEEPQKLIPIFKEICDQAPKFSYGWSSLAWLYLLNNQPEEALKAAKKGVKNSKNSYQTPQSRVNLALAMLASGQKGVREHVEKAQSMINQSEELRQEVEANIEDGLRRKPDWPELEKVKKWLFEY